MPGSTELPKCPKSGLLRSRCRCSDRQCYGRANASERRESRGARRTRKRRAMKRAQILADQQSMVRRMLENHSRAHPEMYSEEFKRARDN